MIENIKRLEPNEPDNEMNISFFSGKSFEYYLHIKKNFIELLEKNPNKLINDYYTKCIQNMENDPKDFIINKMLSEIEEKFDLNLDEEGVEIPDEFLNKLNEAFNSTFKNKYKNLDEDEIIEKIYSIYYQLKNKSLNETIYSSSFFNKIKDVILYSNDLQNKNLDYSISEFISVTDLLFEKKINYQNEEDLKAYNFFQNNIIPKISDLFYRQNWKIKEILKSGKISCLKLIEDEINNAKSRLKDAGNDIKNATEILEMKIKKITKEVFQKKEDEINNLKVELKKLIENSIEEFDSKNNEVMNLEYSENNSIKGKVILGIFTSSISGLGASVGIMSLASGGYTAALTTVGGTIVKAATGSSLAMFFGECALASVGVGLGIGIAITVGGFFLYKYLTKQKKYRESLEKVKSQIDDKYDENIKKIEEDLIKMKDTMINKMNIQIEIRKKNININDMNKWKELKEFYSNLKSNINNRMKNYKL